MTKRVSITVACLLGIFVLVFSGSIDSNSLYTSSVSAQEPTLTPSTANEIIIKLKQNIVSSSTNGTSFKESLEKSTGVKIASVRHVMNYGKADGELGILSSPPSDWPSDVIPPPEGTFCHWDSEYYVLSLPDNSNLELIANKLASNPYVEFALPNYVLHSAKAPNDPFFQKNRQWALKNDVGANLRVEDAWNISTGSPDVVIAVIDTGLDVDHPDLNDKITEERINLHADPPNSDVRDLPLGELQPGHGTSVAGIIAAETDNNEGIAGMAWDARIMPIRAARFDDVYQGVCWAVKNKAHVINISQGKTFTDNDIKDGLAAAQQAIDHAYTNNTVIVVAAGNDRAFLDKSDTNYTLPQELDHVVVVGATNAKDEDCRPAVNPIWNNCGWVGTGAGTGYGPLLDVMAPGSGFMKSTQPGGGYTDWFGGTSASAPYVSGLVALILSVNSNLNPDQVEQIIKDTAKPLDPYGKGHPNWSFGWGRINAFDALNALMPNLTNASQSNPLYAGTASNPKKIVIEVDAWRGFGKGDFEVQINGKPATVVTASQSGDKHFLEVIPPTQSTNGMYDLKIQIGPQYDEERNSVNYADESGIDAVLVIDRSGSMDSFNYMTPAKNAAIQFVDLMHINDKIGVVSFSDFSTLNYGLKTINSDAIKKQAENAINAIYGDGLTSIGAGLQKAQNELNDKGETSHPWAIVLLSDGFENQPPSASDILPGIKSTKTIVHTIALGDYSDEALLLDIASQTGGTYNLVPTADQLERVYNTISGIVSNQQTLFFQGGTVQQGSTNEKSVVVDSTVSEATFSIGWSNSKSSIELTLQKPDGTIINPAVAASNSNIKYVSGSTYRYYRIEEPTLVPGIWKLRVTGGYISPSGLGVTVSAGSEAFTARLTGQAGLTMNSYLDKNIYLTTQPVKVTVSLSDNQPIQGAQVSANVTAPSQAAALIRASDWIEANGDTIPDPNKVAEIENEMVSVASTLTLYDDGKHGDGQANDGVYANTLPGTQTGASGTYVFDITATGKSNSGESFSRLSQHIAFANPHLKVFLPTVMKGHSSGSQPPPPPSNSPPYKPSNPSPTHNTSNMAPTSDLAWTGGDPNNGDSVTYDVYFDANKNNPTTLICDDVSNWSCDIPWLLSYNTDYYWKVVATDNHDATSTGSVWHFKTEAAPPTCNTPGIPTLVSPADNATINENPPTFKWNAASDSNEYHLQVSDNDGSLDYPQEADVLVPGLEYTLPSEISNDTYYWRVRGHNTSNGCDVYGPWSDEWWFNLEAGPVWSPLINLSNSSGFSDSPDVAIDQSGGVNVVWSDNTSGSYDIFHTAKTSGGGWSTPVNVSSQAGDAKYPSLTVDDAGTSHLAWSNNYIYYTKKSADGSWISPELIGIGNKPILAVGSDNSIHIVYEAGAEIYYVVKQNGGNWTSPVNLTNTSGFSYDPDIALDSQNRPHVVWDEQITSYSDIFYASELSSGNWTTPQNISNIAINSHFAKVLIDVGDTVHVFWPNNDAGGTSRVMYNSRPSSGSWSTPTILFDGYTAYHPKPALGSDNSLRVSWTAWTDTYYAKQIGGSWLVPLNVSNNSTNGWTTALDSRGGIDTLVWIDEEPGNQDIFYSEAADDAVWSTPASIMSLSLPSDSLLVPTPTPSSR